MEKSAHAVREIICALLADLGYRVSEAKTANAMRAFVDPADSVDLIVLNATTSAECSIAVDALGPMARHLSGR
jgi:hypothetical protein